MYGNREESTVANPSLNRAKKLIGILNVRPWISALVVIIRVANIAYEIELVVVLSGVEVRSCDPLLTENRFNTIR